MKSTNSFERLMHYLLVITVFLLIICNIFVVICNIFVVNSINSRIFTISQAPTHPLELTTIANIVPNAHPLVDTWNNIHVFLTFDYNISNPIGVANRYDYVWGAAQNHIQPFRTGNTNIFLSYYIPFNRDNNESHELPYWKAFHPDWILYKCDRATPAYEFGNSNMPLDFSNPSVISWQLQTFALPASRSGYNGIAADNVVLENEFGACGSYINGKWVQLFSGEQNDSRWRSAVIGWLMLMQKALHNLPHPLALIPNLSFPSNEQLTSSVMKQVVNHLDGVLDEEGFTLYGDGYLTGTAWLQRIQFMERIQAQHKPYYIVNQFPSVSSDELEWALASYLMGKEHEAALYISTIQGYGSDAWYDEYNAQIGTPSDSMYRKQNVYWRDYSHGLSLVNPSATANYTITLNTNHHYMDLSSHLVGPTIQLPPHSGLVLLLTS